MTFRVVLRPKQLVRAGALLVVAIGASACSTVPNWVDPTTWIGGDDQTATAPDQSTQTADNGQSPDLSTIPDKPETPSTADEQKDVAQSLAGDRTRAQYSADALRGGTEPAAAPPPAEAPATEDLASNDNASEGPAPATPPAAAQMPKSSTPGTLPSDNSSSPAAKSTAAPVQVASAETPPAAAPSVASPAVPAVPALASNAVTPSDAALGFHASNAPPLDPTVAQFVPASILARYRQTASIGPEAAVPASSPVVSDNSVMASTDTTTPPKKSRRHSHLMGMGGPEKMTGAVVANFDALQAGSTAAPAAALTPSGGPQTVVFFPNDITILTADARAQVHATARAFLASGGQGYVRVVGHSSSHTANMTPARHLVWNFERSQARANAVARALISAGVPAQRVLVQAVSDEQPVYQESMPQGEDGNRRAEIFFQS